MVTPLNSPRPGSSTPTPQTPPPPCVPALTLRHPLLLRHPLPLPRVPAHLHPPLPLPRAPSPPPPPPPPPRVSCASPPPPPPPTSVPRASSSPLSPLRVFMRPLLRHPLPRHVFMTLYLPRPPPPPPPRVHAPPPPPSPLRVFLRPFLRHPLPLRVFMRLLRHPLPFRVFLHPSAPPIPSAFPTSSPPATCFQSPPRSPNLRALNINVPGDYTAESIEHMASKLPRLDSPRAPARISVTWETLFRFASSHSSRRYSASLSWSYRLAPLPEYKQWEAAHANDRAPRSRTGEELSLGGCENVGPVGLPPAGEAMPGGWRCLRLARTAVDDAAIVAPSYPEISPGPDDAATGAAGSAPEPPPEISSSPDAAAGVGSASRRATAAAAAAAGSAGPVWMPGGVVYPPGPPSPQLPGNLLATGRRAGKLGWLKWWRWMGGVRRQEEIAGEGLGHEEERMSLLPLSHRSPDPPSIPIPSSLSYSNPSLFRLSHPSLALPPFPPLVHSSIPPLPYPLFPL
ncbi:unnamed protein product [Closterium sp. NIES-64]|nr:unnamed protein product [Closterium sp. NIES-64]